MRPAYGQTAPTSRQRLGKEFDCLEREAADVRCRYLIFACTRRWPLSGRFGRIPIGAVGADGLVIPEIAAVKSIDAILPVPDLAACSRRVGMPVIPKTTVRFINRTLSSRVMAAMTDGSHADNAFRFVPVTIRTGVSASDLGCRGRFLLDTIMTACTARR
jgi:hypothetical protein